MNPNQNQPQQNDYMGNQYAPGFNLNRPRPPDDYNKWMQDMEELIRKIELQLQGAKETTNENGETVLVLLVDSEPIINERGRNMIISRLRSYLSPNTYMSSIDENDTANSYKIDIRAFSADLLKNKVEYGLKLSNYDVIFNMVAPVIFMALRKAQTDKTSIYSKDNPYGMGPAPPAQTGGLFQGLFK